MKPIWPGLSRSPPSRTSTPLSATTSLWHGAGDTLAAIRELIKCVAIRGIPMGPDLVRGCVSWLDAYVGHEDERYLRRLIEDFVFSKRDSSFGNVRGPNRLSTSPWQRTQPAALTGCEAHSAESRNTPAEPSRGLGCRRTAFGARAAVSCSRNPLTLWTSGEPPRSPRHQHRCAAEFPGSPD